MGRRIVRDLLGYVAAAFSASVSLHVIFLVLGFLDDGSNVFAGSNVVVTTIIGAVVIAINAFLPALIIIVLAERFRVRRWYVFTLAGAAAVSFTAVGIHLVGFTGEGSMNPTLLIMLVCAGAVAGFVYWAIAGRLSGGTTLRAETLV